VPTIFNGGVVQLLVARSQRAFWGQSVPIELAEADGAASASRFV